MKREMKKFLSFLMTLTMLLGIVADFNSQYVIAATTPGINVACNSLLIDGVPYIEGINIKDNAEFLLDIVWTANNESGQLGDRITIDLPSCIKFNSISGYPAYDDAGNKVGVYSINNVGGRDVLTLDVTDPEAFKKSNLKGSFTLNGVLDSSKVETVDSVTSKVELFDKTFMVKIKQKEAEKSVSIAKSTSGSYDAEKGQQFNIVLTSKGVNTGLKITDTFDTSALAINGDVTCTATDGTKVNGTLTSNASGFVYNFPSGFETKNNTSYTLTYYLKVTDEGFKNHAGDWENNHAILNTDTEKNKTADSNFNINKTWISKTGSVNGENVNWTITVNAGIPVDIAGTHFSDVLPDDFTMNSDVLISGSDGSSVTIPLSSVSGGRIDYEFPANSTAKYTITYSTKINMDKVGNGTEFNAITGSDTEKNRSTVETPKYGTHYSDTGVHINGIGDVLSKNYTGFRYDAGNGYIAWKSVISLPDDNNFTSLIYEDKVEEYWAHHSLAKDSIKVQYVYGGNTTTVSDYTLSNVSNGGYTIDFGSAYKGKGGSLVITYETVIDTTIVPIGQSVWPSNYGTVKVNGSPQTKQSTYTFTNYPAINKGFFEYNANKTEYTWYVEINLDNVTITNPVYLTEVLPNNMVLDPTSLRFVKGSGQRGEFSTEGVSIESEDPENHTVKIKVDTEKAIKEHSWYGNKICLEYKTKIDNYGEFLKAGKQSFTNEVKIYDKNGNEIGKDSHTIDNIEPNKNNILSKDYNYSIYTAPNIDYEVNVNTDGVKLLDGVSKLEVEDQLGTALAYVPDSLVVYADSARLHPMDSEKYSYTYNKDSKILKIYIPDATPCYISYQAKVLLPVGTKLEGDMASNKVKLSGSLNESVKKSTSIDGVVLKGSALVTSELGSFTLYKHETGDENAPVAGATYTAVIKYAYNVATKEVYEATYETIKNYLPENGGNYVPTKQYVTTSSGTVGISNIYYDFLYEIKEVSAPNGYQVNPTPVYYYIKGDDKADYSSLAAQGIIAHEITSGNYAYIDDSKIDTTKKKVYVNKLISGSSDKLSGAELKITYNDGGVKEFASWTSTTEPKEFVIAKDSDTDKTGMLVPGTVYTLSETSAPNGYAIALPISFTVSAEGKISITSGNGTLTEDNTVLNMNDDRALYFAKVDEDNNSKFVTGATIKIYEQSSGTTVKQWLSATVAQAIPVSTTVEAEKLCVGKTYVMEEVSAPANYKKADDITFTIGTDGRISTSTGTVSSDKLTLTMKDKATGSIQITKVINANASKVLAGAHFKLYAAADTARTNVIAEGDTDASGKLKFENIPYGDYFVVETTVPTGYLVVSETTNITVNSAMVNKQISNTKEPVKNANLTVTKLDNGTSAKLLGATFKLTNAAGTDTYSAEATTDSDGKVKFEKVPFGTYILTETKAPTGYNSVPNSITVTPVAVKETESGASVTIKLDATTLTIIGDDIPEAAVEYRDSELVGSFSFTKKNDAGVALSGAVFTLYDEGNNTVGTATSNGSGVVSFSGLKYGRYYLRETTAPTYHQITISEIPVVIDSPSKTIADVINKQYSFSIGKIAKDQAGSASAAQITGATYEIYDSSSVLKMTFTTGAAPKLIKLGTGADELVPGTYTLKETVVPTGYSKGADITFTVSDTGKVTTSATNATATGDGLLLTILENRTGKLKIVKLDAAAKVDLSNNFVDKFGNPLPSGADPYHEPIVGAQFTLKDKLGNPYPDPISAVKTTDANGEIVFEDLPFDNYTVEETFVPTGYKVIQDSTTVSLDENEKVITLYNVNTTDHVGEIKITKKDADTAALLSGALFALYDVENRLIMSASSDSSGLVAMKNIPYGTYKLKELISPTNYKISDEFVDGVTVKIGLNDDGTKKTVDGDVVTLDFTNKEMKGSLLVNKTGVNSEKLAGAEFKLYTENKASVVDTKTTDADGKVVFGNLSFGTYVLVETKAPDFYVINEAQKETVITINKEDVTTAGVTTYAATADITNDAKYVSFAKQTSLDKTPLAGAKLQILDSSNNVVAEWKSETSDFKLQVAATTDKDAKKIAPGNYTFHEVYAPAGYLTASDISFKINNDGTITSTGVLANDNKTLIMRDAPCGKLILTKTDATDPTLFLKATFKLTKVGDASFAPMERSTTTSDGTVPFDNLPYGTYSLKETVAPDGYVIITEDITVEINETLIKTIGTYGDNCVPVTVTNIQENKVGNIKLTKNDSEDSSKKLADAEFELLNSLDKTVATGKTDANGEIEFKNLPYGTYTIKETKAPKYYGIDAASTSIKVVVGDEGATDVGGEKYFYATATDTLLKGKIEIKKTATLSGKVLSGAKFELYDSTNTLVDTKTTDDNGICTFENLVYGKYKVKEAKAPKYYILSTESKDVLLESSLEKLEFTNEIKKGSLKITKNDVDDNSKHLQGATYTLYDSDNNSVASGTTGEDGTYTFKEVPYGKYTLKETNAPVNYKIDPNPIEVVIDDDTVTTGVGMLAKDVADEFSKGTIKLVKKDSDTKEVLAGAKFELYNSADELIKNTADKDGRWITDKDGKITVENLPYGTYKFKEVEAPEYYNIINDSEDVVVNAESVDVTVYNKNIQILISKRAEGSSDELVGADMVLYDSNSKVVKEWTTTDKAVVLGFGTGEGKVKPGELYRLHEAKAPNGYDVAEDIFFKVDTNPEKHINLLSNTGEVTDTILIMYDATKTVDINISKKAVNGTDELPGATLTIKSQDGTEIASWVSEKAAHTVKVGESKASLLKYDTVYDLVETNAPNGYGYAETIKFKVNKDTGKVEIVGTSGEVSEDGKTLTMRDALSEIVIKISKKAINGTKELPGATLTVRSTDGVDITTWVSNDSQYEIKVGDALTSQLKYDTYYDLVEMNAPNGYGYAESIRFKVSKDTGKIEVVGLNGEVSEDGSTLTMRDDVLKVSNVIYVSKKAAGSNDELAGASFVVTNSANQEIVKWNSTQNAKPFRVGNSEDCIFKYNSEYTLTETLAPMGYKVLTTSIVFKVNEDGKISIVSGPAELSDDHITITVRNEPSTTVNILKAVNINVSKRALGQKGDLSGASLKITDTDNNEIVFWISGAAKSLTVGSDADCLLKYNTEYILIETEAPKGYKIAAPIHFSIGDDGKIVLLSTAGEVEEDGSKLIMIDVPSTTVDTGDHAPILIVGVLLAISLIVMIVLFIINKKKSKDDDEDEE